MVSGRLYTSRLLRKRSVPLEKHHGCQRDGRWQCLSEQYGKFRGSRPVEAGDDDAAEEEHLDVPTGSDQTPDQARSEEAIVEPLVGGQNG